MSIEERRHLFVKPLGFFKYYDGQEGKNLTQKLLASVCPAVTIGSILGTAAAHAPSAYRYKLTYNDKVVIIAKHGLQFGGVAAVFTVATYLATNIRNKDDTHNYELGGIAAGIASGFILNSPFKGFMFSCVFCLAGRFYKEYKVGAATRIRRPQRDFPLFVKEKIYGSIFEVKTPQRWTSVKPEESS